MGERMDNPEHGHKTAKEYAETQFNMPAFEHRLAFMTNASRFEAELAQGLVLNCCSMLHARRLPRDVSSQFLNSVRKRNSKNRNNFKTKLVRIG